MIKNTRFSLKINFLFAAFLFSFSSFSQEVIDEVTVTADYGKRKESDIPSSIFILDEEMIYKASNQHFEDLIQTIPNINWSGDGNRARYFQIRGVGELEQYEGAPNPSIGFLIDDITRHSALSTPLFWPLSRRPPRRRPPRAASRGRTPELKLSCSTRREHYHVPSRPH